MNSVLSFVSCACDSGVLSQYLLASPCLASNKYSQIVYMHANSAAEAFNREMTRQCPAKWLVWVHQDVFLPQGWDSRFIAAIDEAEQCFPKLAVVGVYGVAGAGQEAQRAGHLLDRGLLLREAASLPCLVGSIDELLFAVRTDSGLQIDPALGFDFYGTDLVLSAREQGFQAAVVDSYCEHWAATPQEGDIPPALLDRIMRSGAIFEQKWLHRLPLETPCFSIRKPGDVAAGCRVYQNP